MVILEKYGIVTISAIAAPGAAPYIRLITWPDGQRLGAERIKEAADFGLDVVPRW